MKALLGVSAVIEAGAGLALVAFPVAAASLLVGSSSGAPSELLVARVAGVALLALAAGCWRARGEARAARPLVVAMLVYDAGVAALLVHAAATPGSSGVTPWPAAALHAGMAVWCVLALTRTVNAPDSR